MNTLYLDLETYSDVPITHGTHAYAEKAEVLLVALAWDATPVTVFEGLGQNIQPLIDRADKIVIHNSAFDRTVLRHCGVHIPIEKIEDTMVMALAHSLPGSLGQLCDILDVPTDKAKDKEGKKLIQLFTKPRPKNMKLRRATAETHPEEWKAFCAYACSDIRAMREVYERLPRWNFTPFERKLWLLDQTINDRGIAVDVDLARAALRAADRAQSVLSARANKLTGGAVGSLTQRAKLKEHLENEHAFEIDDLTKGTVSAKLKGHLTDEVRELLEVRQQASMTSPAKYAVLTKATSGDGRLRGTLQFCGASRTGRWGGRLFQPQNLPRPTLKNDLIEAGIAAMKLDCEDLVVDNVMELCSSAVRGALIAPPGKKLIVADLSNIEGRVLAWLAGEDWKIEAFKKFDRGEAQDIYVLAYARSFGVTPEAVIDNKKNGDGMMRLLGKVMELACLGPNTQVVTNNGNKAIVDVTKADLLWDGEEWVRHAGLVPRGVRQTVDVAGIKATADHMFLTTHGWRPAQQLASNQNTLRLALATGLENSPSRGTSWARQAASGLSKCDARAVRPSTPFKHTTSVKARVHIARRVLKNRAVIGVKTFLNTPTRYRMTTIVGVFSTGFRRAKLAATALRRSSITLTAGGAFTSAKTGGATNVLSSHTSKPWKDGINRVWTWIASTTKKATSRATYVLLAEKKTTRTDELSEKCKHVSQTLRPVYDIAHAGPRNRFTVMSDLGPLIVHNCGYGGGLGAFTKMAALYGIEKSEEDVALIVKAWRKAHPRTVSLWYDVENAVRRAIREGGRLKVQDIEIDVVDGWLRLRLPSGRYLCYPNICLNDAGNIVYDGTNQFTRKWEQIETYGARLVENLSQAAARDVLAHGMIGAEAAGYEVVLDIHDEIISETPDTPGYTAEGLSDIMSATTSWSLGLPLSAAGFSCHRYRKG